MKNLFCFALALCLSFNVFAKNDGCSGSLEDCYHKGKNVVNKINQTKDMDKEEYFKKKASSKLKVGCKNGNSKSCKEYNRLKKLKKIIK
jgi:hypothetical protein